MSDLEFLSAIQNIQNEMKSLYQDERFISVSPHSVQVSADMFKRVFPENQRFTEKDENGVRYSCSLAGMNIVAYQREDLLDGHTNEHENS